MCNTFSPYMHGVMLEHYFTRLYEVNTTAAIKFILQQISYHASKTKTFS